MAELDRDDRNGRFPLAHIPLPNNFGYLRFSSLFFMSGKIPDIIGMALFSPPVFVPRRAGAFAFKVSQTLVVF
jgi:hypothetical protein